MVWQVQEAKQRFSQLVQRALDDGPQVVTRHGKEVVVVVSAADYERLSHTKMDFRDFLMSAPPLDELEIARDRSPRREVDL